MAKYVKLGEKASSFSDPSTKLTLKPGEVKELTNPEVQAKKVKKALQGGHLVPVSKDDFDKYKSGVKSDDSDEDDDEDEDEDEELTFDSLMALKKPELVKKALDAELGSEEELEKMNKETLSNLILENEE